MLFVLNIKGLIIIYINLNDKIDKRVIRVVSYYSITNRIIFEFINFDTIILHIIFKLSNTMKYIYIYIY